MNIVLIGYRGTGKTVVGKLLSQELNMVCEGVDENIVKRAGMSIPEIVEKQGWVKFRDLESQEVKDLAKRDHIIIDTGGGVIERPENIKALKQNGRIIWLKASVDIIVSRIQGGTERPALTDGKTFTEEVAEVMANRTPKYKQTADYEIDTDELTPSQIINQILAKWRE